MFEVRHMDIEADIAQRPALASEKNFLEGSRMTKNEEKSEVGSDEKHIYYSPSRSNQWSTDKPTSKRGSGICVYTYKVNSLDFHPFFFLCIFLHYDRNILMCKKDILCLNIGIS